MKSKFFLERIGIRYCIRLNEGVNIVGRASNAAVKISGPFASRNHCHIVVDAESVSLEDFSTNGTFVNEIEFKQTSTTIKEDDKIGIGVYGIDEFLEDSKYHVYRLRKINVVESSFTDDIGKQITENLIVLSEDESSGDEGQNLEKNIGDCEVIDVVEEKNSKGAGQSITVFKKPGNNEKTVLKSSNKKKCTNEKEKTNKNFLDDKLIKTVSVSPNHETCNHDFSNKPIQKSDILGDELTLSDENAYTFIVKSDKEKNNYEMKTYTNLSSEGKEGDCDLFEFQSDEFSQAVWDEIKQEIADLDFTELENDENFQNVGNNSPAIDVLDLTLDDDALNNEKDEELDLKTRTWFMKLSQNFEETYEKKSKSNNCISIETKSPDNVEQETSLKNGSTKKLVRNHSSSKSDNSTEKSVNVNIIKSDGELKTDKKKSNVVIIDPPSIPSKKGKHRGVSANLTTDKSSVQFTKSPNKIVKSPSNQVKSQKKNIRSHYSRTENQSLKLQKKWLEKPNSVKEKNKKILIKDKRKEKLKELAEKNCIKNKPENNVQKIAEKRKLSIDNLDDEEKDKVIKKAKVKITNKNRGAFLTEFSNITTTNIANRRKSVDASSSCESGFLNALSSADKILTKAIDIGKTAGKPNKIEIRATANKTNTCSVSNHSTNLINTDKTNASIKENMTIIKPCIKLSGIEILKNNNNKKVKFNCKPTVYIYYVEEESKANQTFIKEVNTKNVMKPDLSHFESRKRIWQLKCPRSSGFNIAEILSEILAWKPEWFNDKDKANINGTSLLCPMIHSFKTLEDYQKIVFPLMKLELWERLLKDRKTNEDKVIQLSLQKFEIIEQTPVKKIFYHCEYTSSLPLNKPLFYSNELVFIKVLNKENIFGHVVLNRVLNPNSSTVSKTYSVKIESNYYANFLNELRNTKVIKVQKVSVIATELGAFEAVNNLIYSPLLKEILNPRSLLQLDEFEAENQIKKYKYNGYDQLNETQENILMKTYLRTINPSKGSITLIEGPPGTGKSKLITNLVLQLQYGLELRHLDRKILVCAQSNVAVDVITQKLIRIRKKMDSKKFRLVRYGVLDKMHPEVKPYSLTELIRLQRRSTKQTPRMTALLDEKQLLEQKVKKLEIRRKSNSRDDSDLEKARKDLNQINILLTDNFNEIDRDIEYKFLANANIVCTTLSSCVRLLRYCNFFDVCIIDEATQCNEPWTLVPLQFGINSLILIGDTQQLPATTLSYLSKSYNYGKSYFTRAKEIIENRFIMSLNIQYRMHPEICKWPNSYFYRNRLVNSEITTNFKPIFKPYTIIELNFNQNKATTNGIENCSEADFIVRLVQGLVDVMPTQKYSYGIITPYNLHCHNLREKLRKEKLEIEVNTIDSYQGKEKDIIIISNARTEGIGFLNEICRLNVALTRAKKCLILCGNFQHLSNINVWKSLLSDAKKRGIYFEPNENDIKDFKNKIINYLKL